MKGKNQVKRSILITGGLGFIGKHLTRLLLSRNHGTIYILDNLSNSSREDFEEFDKQGVQLIIHDIATDFPEVHEKIDIVFHLAALVSVPESFKQPLVTHKVNETGFINVLEFCKVHQVEKLVYASSCAVYGESTDIPLKESERVIPTSPYGLTKLNNEHYARFFHQAYGLESIGLRFFNVYGPGQKPNSAYAGVISIFMDKVINDLPVNIYGNGEQLRDFVYVKDIARALIEAGESEQKLAVYNIGTGHPTSVNELFRIIAEVAAYSRSAVYMSPRLGDVEISCADLSKMKDELKFAFKSSLKQGLSELYAVLTSDVK